MICTADVEKIIYSDCKQFGIDIQPLGKKHEEVLKEDRIFINVKRHERGDYWIKGFVEVNFYAPDIKGEPAKIRLEELERMGLDYFFSQEHTGEHDSTHYIYSFVSEGIEKDESLKSHYVNFRLLFQILNVR